MLPDHLPSTLAHLEPRPERRQNPESGDAKSTLELDEGEPMEMDGGKTFAMMNTDETDDDCESESEQERRI